MTSKRAEVSAQHEGSDPEKRSAPSSPRSVVFAPFANHLTSDTSSRPSLISITLPDVATRM